jgi:uncharacterized protein (DUF952 family)
MTANQRIFHIAEPGAWDPPTSYAPPSLAEEGFIHCSTMEQVARVANDLFAGRNDLTVLVIDAAAVEASLVFEDSYGLGEEFPHLYRPLEVSDVIQELPLPVGPDGRFEPLAAMDES